MTSASTSCCTYKATAAVDAYHTCLSLQASTYDFYELAEALTIMLRDLWNTMGSENEYDAKVASTLAYMLHPNTSARAPVTEVLQSAMFAHC